MARSYFAQHTYREAVFMLMECYGSRVIDRFPDQEDCFFPFFVELFACQKHFLSKPLALGNLTNEEKLIIHNHMPIFLTNFMHFNFTNVENVAREFISGLVLFRTEILPMFQKIFDPARAVDLTIYNLRFNYWEKHYKQFVLSGYKEGKFETINGRFVRCVTKKVRATDKWWNADYNESDDRIDCLEQEYLLED